MNKLLNSLTHYLFILVVLGYIVYEELVWERFAQPIVLYIKSLNILKKLEAYLQGVNGVVVLFTFVLLFAVVELQGIYAGILLLKGKVLLWILLYAGKVPVAAFTFWLFSVTKPKLMAFSWFEKSYVFLMQMIAWIKATDIYKNIKIKTAETKSYIKKHYLPEGDSTKKKFKKVYRRLKIRLKEITKR